MQRKACAERPALSMGQIREDFRLATTKDNILAVDTPAGPSQMDQLFTFTETSTGWFTIKPAQNFPNWTDLCLSIWAKDPNADLSAGNILGSGAAPVIQFTCQPTSPGNNGPPQKPTATQPQRLAPKTAHQHQ